MSYISVENLYFSYSDDDNFVIRNLSFEIKKGSFVAIQGPSGSGKSTLLYLLGAMNRFRSGSLKINNIDLNSLTREQASIFRASEIGFVFQQFHLLPKLNLLENVMMGGLYPLELEKDFNVIKARAEDLLSQFGLSDKKLFMPNKISGGQQQRVAIARALMQQPDIILADEPTGNLDSVNSDLVMKEFEKLHQAGHTVIIITHENDVAKRAERIITIKDGTVESDQATEQKVTTVKSETLKKDLSLNQLKTPKVFGYSLWIFLLKNAWYQLSNNKIRSILTMIGVTIGVAAVLVMVTLGSFAKEKILAGYAELGVNTFVFNGRPNWNLKSKEITGEVFSFFKWERDLEPLKNIFPEIGRISPVLTGWGISAVYAGKTIETDVRSVGVNEDTFAITRKKMLIGSTITPFHVENRSAVCVIGYGIAEELFSKVKPLGQILNLIEDGQDMSCRVIGVAADTSSRSEWRKPNLEVYLPFTYFQAKSKNWWSSQIREVMIEVADGTSMEAFGRGIKGFFEKKYGKTGKFRADSDAILIEQMTRFLNIFSGFLAAVAIVTLSVGGVGIANMMLVSLNERIREIGLRKSLGATDRSLRLLILMESMLICVVAGFIGVFLGFVSYELILFVASKLIGKLPFEWIFNPWAFFSSFFAIVAVGIFSGLVPSLRAEKLAPMQALRSD